MKRCCKATNPCALLHNQVSSSIAFPSEGHAFSTDFGRTLSSTRAKFPPPYPREGREREGEKERVYCTILLGAIPSFLFPRFANFETQAQDTARMRGKIVIRRVCTRALSIFSTVSDLLSLSPSSCSSSCSSSCVSDRVTGTCSWLFLCAYSSVRAKTRAHYAHYHHQDTLKVAMSHEMGSRC